MLIRTFSIPAVLFLVLGFGVPLASAQWTADGAHIVTQQLYEFRGTLAPDGTGGAFVFYADDHFTTYTTDIYAVRVDGDGNLVWPAPVTVTEATGNDVVLSACPDGAGGAYVYFMQNYGTASSQLFVQRFDADGTPLFSGKGVVIKNGDIEWGIMVSAGQGGVFAFWDEYNGGDLDIRAQRVSPEGALQWMVTGGLVICGETDDQFEPVAVALPNGEAVVSWRDYRDRATNNMDIYAQRVQADGTQLWGTSGLGVCTETAEANQPGITLNPLGGVVIAWIDRRINAIGDIYAQYLALDGSPNWTAGGTVVAAGANQQTSPEVACFGNGATGVVWNEFVDVSTRKIGMNYIFPTGSVYFPGGWFLDNGPIAFSQRLMADALGGVTAVWVSNSSGQNEIYATRFVGTLQSWGPVLVSSDPGFSKNPSIVTDGLGGSVITFQQSSSEGWAQRLGSNGAWGYPSGNIAAVEDVPEDEGGWIRVRCAASRLDSEPGNATVLGYNVWRQLPVGAKAAGVLPTIEEMMDGKAVGRQLAPATAKAAGLPPGTWESAGFHMAIGLSEYLFLAPTHADSSSAGVGWETFCVTTHMDVGGVIYTSQPDSGYSVDNLAPSQPKNVSGSVSWIEGGVILEWGAGGKAADEDIASYNVYRGDVSDFPLDSGHLIGATDLTSYFDAYLPGGAVYYKITAVDRHDNESEPALLSYEQISGIEDTVPHRSFLAQNHPNPFNPMTTITFELATAGPVRLEVFDVAGRRVRTLIDGETMVPGPKQAVWRGSDDTGQAVPAGAYFYRLMAGEFQATRQMMLVR